MNPSFKTATAVAVLAFSPIAAQAGDHILQGRVTPLGYGGYDFELGITDSTGTSSSDASGTYLSADLGFTYAYSLGNGSSIISDLELEYFMVDIDDSSAEFDRTDMKLTAGYKTPVNVVPFIGYRRAVQGDGLFSDDFAIEDGFFLGASYVGIPMGDWANLSVSAAYNFNNYEDTPTSLDWDTAGLSTKVSLLLSSIPLAFNLKYQSFSESDSKDLRSAGAQSFNYKETYTTYIGITWYYATKVM